MEEILLREKKCNVCHQVKPLSEFVKEKDFKDGYRPLCKDCKNKRLKEYTKKWAEERSNTTYFPKEKQCKDCLEVKPIDEFTKDKYQKDGKSHVCKECKAKRQKKMIERWKKERTTLPEDKECIKCHRILPSSQFTNNINSKDGLDSLCKDCQTQRSIEYKKRWKEERLQKPDSIKEKECPTCHRILPVSEFYESDSHKDGLSFYCKECELQNQKRFAKKWEKERSKKKTNLKRKECNICHRVLPIAQFYKNRRFKDGISAACIDCETKRQIEYIANWKEERDQQEEVMAGKECIKCHRILPISHFNKNKRRKDGLTSACKDCEVERQDAYIEKWTEERKKKKDDSFTLFPTFEKKCNTCKRTLPTSQFYPKAGSKDGLSSNCIACDRKIVKETRKKYLKSGKWKDNLKNIPKEKECRRCHKILPSSQFHKRKESKDGLALYCIQCVSIKNKEYRNNPENRERLLKYWREHNRRPEVRAQNRKWARKYAKRSYVKEKRKAYMKEYCSRPEVQKRRKEYMREYHQRPEVRERTKQYYKTYQKRKKVKEKSAA